MRAKEFLEQYLISDGKLNCLSCPFYKECQKTKVQQKVILSCAEVLSEELDLDLYEKEKKSMVFKNDFYMLSAEKAKELTAQKSFEEIAQQKLNEFSTIISQAAAQGHREVPLSIWHKGRVREIIVKELTNAGYEVISNYGGVTVRW